MKSNCARQGSRQLSMACNGLDSGVCFHPRTSEALSSTRAEGEFKLALGTHHGDVGAVSHNVLTMAWTEWPLST